MAQIVPVVSEALEAQIRNLLPSQRGFGEDLQASNVITPIIDLTAAAEGSATPQFLQTALAFGSQTAFDVANTTTVLANTAGFWRIFGAVSIRGDNSSTSSASFTMTDGLSTKQIYELALTTVNNTNVTSQNFDFNVFLASGESISAVSNKAGVIIAGSVRQIADVNGTLVNPSGFTPQ